MTPSKRLQDFLDSGRLIRKAWTGTDAQGRETACLLAALSPEVAATHSEAVRAAEGAAPLAAARAAEEAAADRITAAIFDAIEVKIEEAEKRT